jgi:phosphoribulokinase
MADPQKQYADAVIEVLPTQLIPDDNEGKVLRVKLIQKEGVKHFNPVYLFDEGSSINWVPCGRKLTCSYPGIKFSYGPDAYYGHEVTHLGVSALFYLSGKNNCCHLKTKLTPYINLDGNPKYGQKLQNHF